MNGAPPAVSITPARPAHADVLAALHERCLGRRWSGESLARLLVLPGAYAYMAVTTGGSPVGFALCLGAGPAAPEQVELLAVGVVPDRRRHGIGRALMARCLRRAVRAGARAMTLEVAAENGAARNLYQGVGFVQVGHRPAYYENGGDALVLRAGLGAAHAGSASTTRRRQYIHGSARRPIRLDKK